MPHLQEILWMEILHPFDMWFIPLFTRFYLSQVLQDSFHQQYIHFHARSMLHCHVYQRCSVNSFSFTFGGSLLQERSLSLHTRRWVNCWREWKWRLGYWMSGEVAPGNENPVLRGVLSWMSSALWKGFHADAWRWFFLRKKMWNGLPYCLQNLRQEMEQAFDALAVYDTRPSAENCHVMGWWFLSQSNGSPSDHPLPRTYTKLYMVNEQPFFDSITGPFQCHGARSCFLSCGYAQTKNRTYAAYNSWLTIMSSLY